MIRFLKNHSAIVVLTLIAALTLSACGRRGTLDTPAMAAAEKRKQAEKEGKASDIPAEDTKPADPEREIFLDKLLF